MKTEVRFISKYNVKGIDNYATIQDCIEYLQQQKLIGLDIETTRKFKKGEYNEEVYQGGLDPYLTRIVMIQVGTIDLSFVIDVRDFSKEELKPLLDFLDWNDDIVLVGHNLKFEGRHLKHNYQINLKHVHDTMVTDIVLTNGLPYKYGLANLAERYLAIPMKKENTLFESAYDKKIVSREDEFVNRADFAITPFEIEDNFFIDKSTRMQFINIGEKQFTKKQILYGSDDIVLPLLIRERQLTGRKLSTGEIYLPLKLIKIENTFTQVLADVENNGMSFVPVKWLEVAEKAEKIYTERLKKLNDYVTSLYPYMTQLNLFDDNDCAISWSSHKQVISFFRRLGFCPQEWSKDTGRKEYTVGAVALLKLLPNIYKEYYFKDKWIDIPKEDTGYSEDHNRLILAFLLLSKSHQAITTFGRSWLKYVHPITGRVHPNFRQILNTGRLSSSNPNLLNIKGGDYRKCFMVGDDEWMVNTDYSAQEIRILADNSGDPLFVSFFTVGDEFYGEDFHSFTATKVFSIMRNDPDFVVPPKELPTTGEDNPEFTEEHKTMRDKAKTVNFGIAYGKSPKGFSDDFGMSIEDAETLIQSYLTIYEDLDKYFQSQRKKAQKTPYIQIDSFTDRRWFNPRFEEMDKIQQEIWAHFPEDYRFKSKAERDEIKAEIYEDYPEIPYMWKDYFGKLGSYERKFLNYPIQGSASSILKIGMCGLRNEAIEKGYNDFKLTNFVHDEVLAEVPKEKGDLYGEMLSKWMVKGGDYICKQVPMVANYKLKDIWTH